MLQLNSWLRTRLPFFCLASVVCLLFALQAKGQKFERIKWLKDSTHKSQALGYDKQLNIWVPWEYSSLDTMHRYPLVIIFDRQNERSYQYLLQTIDYLVANEQMPAPVIVGVSSDMENRYAETQYPISDPAGRADRNEKFVIDELLGLGKQLQCTPYNILIGHSRYGFFTSALFIRQPQHFSATVALSPFFQQKNIDLCDSLKAILPAKGQRYYRFAIGNDYPEEFQRFEAKKLKINSSSRGLQLQGHLFPEADHNVVPGLYAGRALYEIFEYWSKQQHAFMMDTLQSDIAQWQQAINAHYGATLGFALGNLNGKAWAYFNKKQWQKAIDTWELTLQNYPGFAEAYLYIAMAQKEADLDYAASLKQFFIGLHRSEYYSQEERDELIQEGEAMLHP